MSTSGLKHAVIEQNNLEKRKNRRGTGGRTATLRRAPSDSDCSGETASLSADSDKHRPIPVAHTTLHSRSFRRRGSEWEVLEGLKDGQRFERRPEVFNGYLHKKRKWPLKGWHKICLSGIHGKTTLEKVWNIVHRAGQRFFVIDGGILVYARSPTDVARGRLHGSVDVGLSVISAKQRRRRIDIDADEFIYHLRAKTPDVFRTWLSVLKAHRLYRQHLLTFGARESVPKTPLSKEDIAPTDTSSRESVTRTTSTSLSNTSEESISSSLKTFAPVSTYRSPGQFNSNPFSISFNTIGSITKGKDGPFNIGCSDSSLCKRKKVLTKYARKEFRLPKKEVVFICDDETGKSSIEPDVSKSEVFNRALVKESTFGFKTLCHCNKVDIRPTYFFFAKHRRKKEKLDNPRLPKSRKCTNLFKYKLKPEPLIYNSGVCVLKKRRPIAEQVESSNQTSFREKPKIAKELSKNSLLNEDFMRIHEPNLNSIMSESFFPNNEEHTDLECANIKEGSSKCGDYTEISLDTSKESIQKSDNISIDAKSLLKLSLKCNEKLSNDLYSSDNFVESAIDECVQRNFEKAGRPKQIDNIFSNMTVNKDKANKMEKIFSKMAIIKNKAEEMNLNIHRINEKFNEKKASVEMNLNIHRINEKNNENKASVRTLLYADPVGEVLAIPTLFPNYTKKPALDMPGWNSYEENEVELRNKFYGDVKTKVSERSNKDVTKLKASRNNVNTKCNIKLKTETYMTAESSTDTAQLIKSDVWDPPSENSKEKTLEFSISNYKTAKVFVNRDINGDDITITLKLNKEHCKKDMTAVNPSQSKNRYQYCNYQVPKPKYFSPFIKKSEKITSLALKHADEQNENSELSTGNESKQNEVIITTKVDKTSTTDSTSTFSVGKRKVYLKKQSDILVPCVRIKSIKSFNTPKEMTSSSSSKLKKKSYSDCGAKKILTLFVNNPHSNKPEEKKANAPAIPIPFDYSALSKIINIKSSTEIKPETTNIELVKTIEKITQSHEKSTGSNDKITINISTTTSMSGLITTEVKEISVSDFRETKEQATMPGSETNFEMSLENLSSAQIENVLVRGVSYVKCVAEDDSQSSLHTLKNASNSSSVRSFCLPEVQATDISEKAIQATYNQLQDLAVNTDFDSDPANTDLEYDPDFDYINKYIGSRLLPGAKRYFCPGAMIQTIVDSSSSNFSTKTKMLKEVGSNTTGHIKLFHNKRRRVDKYNRSNPEMSDFSDQIMLEDAYEKRCCQFGRQQYYQTYQVLINEKVAVTSVKPNVNCSHCRVGGTNRCNGDIEPLSGLISPSSPTLRGPQAGFVSGTPGGRLASWIVESGGPLENASREIGQAQLSVQQLQRLLDTLELQQQMHHDTDVSLEGASPNVKKDRRKFGLRKKKSNSKCASVELAPPHHLEVSGSHSALSALTAPPSPGGGMPASIPNSAASLPIACSAVRPQSLPGAESLTGTAGVPLSTFTPEHQLREDFAVLAKDLLSSLKSVVGTLVSERSRLRAAMESADQGTPTNTAFVAALRSNLNTALQQNSELRSRLSRIHDASDIAEMSSMGNNSDPVPRHIRQSMSFSSSCVSASEFFDAEAHSDDPQDNHVAADEAGVIELDGDSTSEAGSLTSEDGASGSSDNSDAGCPTRTTAVEPQHSVPAPRWSRRSALPAPRPSPQGPTLWNLLYKNIGKDLSQISMPVSINEPLNMLQRLCEELEYSELLDAAAKTQEPMERMCLMAAFAVSAYASSSHRAASKPFNPLLGETYECRRTDRDFVFLAEQVSHHPPISACHAESPRWVFWQEARIKTKFWGKSMEFQPCSRVHVKLKTTGDHYTWNKVTTCVHNLFGGQRWVDQYGDMHITCHGTDMTCKLNFVKASSWSTSRHEVRGSVLGPGSRRVPVSGRWSEALYAGEPPHNRCLWRPGAMPAEHELYYGFTRFAMELNELEPDMLEHLPPTDTRFRPDQRALEEGEIEAAEQYKYQVEEAQRERRRDKCEPTPQWFHKSYENGEEMWVFNNEYWKAREAGFPDHNTKLW